jgi:hypothetical protein
MNGFSKHAGGFSFHYLKDIGVDERVVSDFISEFIDPALAHSAEQCVWDSASKTIKTADEHADEAGMVELEKSSWFIDIMAKTQEKEESKRGKYASAANLFDLDAQSAKTMHGKNDVVELDGDEDGDGSLSSATKTKRKSKAAGADPAATGKQSANRSESSEDTEEEELLGVGEQDSSREAPAGHTDATGLREGHTPSSVGVRFTQKEQCVEEQVSPESDDDDIEMSSTASAAGHVDEVTGKSG